MPEFERLSVADKEDKPTLNQVAESMLASANSRFLADQRASAHDTATNSWEKTALDFSGTLSAGTVGTIVWALAGSKLNLPLKVLSTAVAAGSTRVLVQGGLERLILPEEQRKSTLENFAWGTVDGFAGVIGSAAESAAGKGALRRLGTGYLGTVSREIAETAGAKAVENSLTSKFSYNITRGIAGGGAGSLVWSLPHEIYNHRDKLDTTQGLLETIHSVGVDTALGALTGGVIAGGFTAVGNMGDINGYAGAKLRGDAGITRADLLHINDLHSSLVGDNGTLPQLATKIKEQQAVAAMKGRTAPFYDAGDNFSGNVAASFTEIGYVETKAINMLKPTGVVAGNHVADAGQGKLNIEAWVNNTHRISSELGWEVPGLGANIELPQYPGFIGPQGTVYKPYRISEIANQHGGTDKLASVGLTTKELAENADLGQIRYLDAQGQAKRWIAHINAPISEGGEGVNKIVVNSHLGRSEDIKLAQNVKGISYIVSAHSHDAEPVILWVTNLETGWDVPILQAGSKGKWLAETNIAFKQNGAADKYRTFGRLHRIDASVLPDPEIKRFIDSHLKDIARLEAEKYPTPVIAGFTTDGVRGQQVAQTELGTLSAKAMLNGVNKHLGALNTERAVQGLEPIRKMSIMLEHSGSLRAGLEPGIQSRRSLSDVIINSGGALEKQELATAVFTGSEISRILDFSVADLPKPLHVSGKTNWRSFLNTTKELFLGQPAEPIHDYSGNFLHTEGLKYSLDLSKTIGSRVRDVRVVNPATGQYVPIDKNTRYDVLCRFHPLEKWNKNGVFGETLKTGGKDAIRAHAEVKPITLSQVDLLAEHLTSKPFLSPADYVSDNIRNLTPPRWDPTVRPRLATLGVLGFESVMQEFNRTTQ